jgi:hypothetical protein
MAAAAAPASATTAGPVQFNRDIRPILSDHCFSCHGPDVQKMKGGLRLDLREAALRPAKSGKKAILPRDAAGSELVHRLLTDDDRPAHAERNTPPHTLAGRRMTGNCRRHGVGDERRLHLRRRETGLQADSIKERGPWTIGNSGHDAPPG